MPKRVLYVIAAIILLFACLYLRAANGRDARSQAEKIVSTDAAGTDTTAAISSLKFFVQNHTGASVSFTLKGSYDRAVAAAQAAAAATTANSQVYADAQRACSSKSDSLVQARCNQAYLAAHLVAPAGPSTVLAPELTKYQYKLQSPVWAPDLAGAALLGALAAIIAFFVTGIGRRRALH